MCIHRIAILAGLLLGMAGSAWADEPNAKPIDKAQAVFAEIDRFYKVGDHAGAVEYLDKVLPTVTDNALRWRLEESRQTFLEWQGHYEEALENARRLLQIKSITSELHQRLLAREAYNLINCGQFEEYIVRWTRRFENAIDHPADRLKLLSEKAQYFLSNPDVKRSVAAWREYRRATVLFSDDWENGTCLLARELTRGGDHRSAISLWEELIRFYRTTGRQETAYALLTIADAQRAAGLLDEAQRSLEAAQTAIAIEPLDDKEAQALRSRLDAIQEAIHRAE